MFYFGWLLPKPINQRITFYMLSKSIVKVLLFALIFISINSAFAQAPSFNYPAGAHNYTTGTSINPLVPNSSGGPVPPAIYGQVTTLAGDGTLGATDGVGTAASLSGPLGVALDKSGNLFVTDYYVKGVTYYNNLIRKITPGGIVTTFAGDGNQGFLNGQGIGAEFSVPNGVAVDGAGNAYVADVDNNRIRMITPTGFVSTFAGTGARGATDGVGSGPLAVATFNAPSAIAVDGSGNLYVADYSNNNIRKITPAGIVSTLAGSGSLGFNNGTGINASFNQPNGVAVDASGNVYVSDAGNSVIRKITAGGIVSTYAGSGTAGSADGAAGVASFRRPAGLTIDLGGNIFVADAANNVIRKISPTGVVSTLAGSGTLGSANGIGTAASFFDPEGVVVDANGDIYVGDKGNNLVRKITASGYTISPALPAGLNFDGTSGIISGNPSAPSASTTYTITGYNVYGSSTAQVTISVTGNIIVHTAPPVIAYVTPQVYKVNLTIAPLAPTNGGGAVPPSIYGGVTIFAGSGIPGAANGTGALATFNGPDGTAVDAAGNVYVVDAANKIIRKITPAGVVTTFASGFNSPTGIAVDAAGNVYVSDFGTKVIYKITPGGAVGTFASGFSSPGGVAVDGTGNVYVADIGSNQIKKITPAGTVSVFAGSGSFGSANGVGTAASFSAPAGVAIDAAGYLYVTDSGNQLIRKITPGGLVSTLAGSGIAGSADGIGAAASFKNPDGIAVDGVGNLYIADSGNSTIRKVTPAGIVTTLAGTAGSPGRGNGQGPAASFNDPRGVAIDANGNLFIGDLVNNIIREISTDGYTISPGLPAGLTFDSKTGTISGTPTAASPATNYTITAYNAGGSSTFVVNITVQNPIIIAVPPPIISYVSPQNYLINAPIIPLGPANTGGAVPQTIYGQVSTFAGNGASGAANGTGTAASFSVLHSIGTDLVGNVYVTDNNLIRKISPSGIVNTLAGSAAAGSADGTGAAASFNQPMGIAVDGTGIIYVADTKNNVIRMVTQGGQVTTIAGTAGAPGLTNGTGATARFNAPSSIAVDDQTGNIYVADAGNNVIRKITPGGLVSTFAVGFNNPVGITIDQNGNLYVANAGDNTIKKITPAGVVSTFAGSGGVGSANGQGTAASFNKPLGVSADVSGNVYVADNGNNLIRKITPGGLVTTLAGSGAAGAVNGPVTTASFNHPDGVSADIFGNVYVTDVNNFLIRQIVTTGYTISPGLPAGLTFDGKTGIISGTPTVLSPTTIYTVTAYNIGGSSSTQISITVSGTVIPPVPPPNISYTPNLVFYTVGTPIPPAVPVNKGGILPNDIFGQTTTIAGTGSPGSADGTGTNASFHDPFGVATDTKGNIYVVDELNNLIRKITPTGVVTTLAGSGSIGSADGTGTAASFNNPTGIAVDVAGNVYVADVSNNEIRKISPSGVVTTLAGSGAQGAADGSGTAATFSNPAGLAVDGAGNIYVADLSNNLIRKITPGGVVTTLAGSGLSGSADGTGAGASFNQPYGVAVDRNGNVYVADWGNNEIRKITPAGVVTTIAGGIAPGSADGQGTAASFNKPFGLAIDENGNIYVADTGNEKIRMITPAGAVSTVAGNGSKGAVNGTGSQTSFYQPVGIVSDGAGDIYVADEFNDLIRKVVVVSNYTIDKTLPPGLTFDPTTGTISGTPTAVYPTTTYNVTAFNLGGSSTTQITLTVKPAPVLPQTLTYGPLPDKTYGDPDFDPGATSTNLTIPITYTSSDPTKATIVNGQIHITGAGTVTITASQAGNAGYTPATPIDQVLTINKALLTITANDQTKVFGTPNPDFGVGYVGFVYGENQTQLITQPTVTTIATTMSPAGTYILTPGGAQSNNYTFNYITGILTIKPVPPTIIIPNTFTPNGDGINDVWNIKALVDYPQCIVSIYTRYGSLVYQSKGYPTPWDGTYNGSKLPDGTYYYIIKPEPAMKTMAGYVTIIR